MPIIKGCKSFSHVGSVIKNIIKDSWKFTRISYVVSQMPDLGPEHDTSRCGLDEHQETFQGTCW